MGSSRQWSNNNNNQRNNNNKQRNQGQRNAQNNSQEVKDDQSMNISYGFEKKGFRFDTELESGKPSASNIPIIMLDTGNACVPGRCYDHHQLSQDSKSKFPSATAIVHAKASEIYEANKDNERTKIICHDDPDNDAILSTYLTEMIIKTGRIPYSAKEVVRVANESDTFRFKTSFNYGSCLDALTKELWPKNKNAFHDKQVAMQNLIGFCDDVNHYYSKALSEEKDPEKKANISIDKVLNEMLQKGSDYQKHYGANWRALNKIKDQVIEQNRGYEDLYKQIKNNEISCKNRDMQQERMENDPYASYTGLSHEEFNVKLVKKQTTPEEKQKDFESAEKSARVFFYTGTKKIPAPTLLKAFENYDVIVYNQYDLDKKTVTYKISTNSKDYDLGHLGRVIETELYKEKLNKDESKIKDQKEFEDKKKWFEERKVKALPESRRRSHFTGLDSICGTDPTFTGFTVGKDSNLYELDNVKNMMKEYFAEPHKVKKQNFIDEIGKENYEEILKQKYPADYIDVEKATEVVEDIDKKSKDEIVTNVPDISDQTEYVNEPVDEKDDELEIE